MKIILVLIFLMPSLSYAADCVNKIAKSEFIKRVNNVPNAGLLTCKDLPAEPCFCLDGKSDHRKWKLGLINGKEDIVIDVAGSQAADDEDAQKAADKIIRDSKGADREVDLDNCILTTKSGVLTLPELNACFRAHLRDTRGDKVKVEDL